MVITQCAQCIARLLGLMVYLPIYYLSTYQTFCCTEGRCFKKHTIFGWLYILIFDSRNRVRTITRKFLSIFLVKKILSKLLFRDPFQQFILCWYILMMESGNIQKHYEYIMKFRALFSAEFPFQARISINRVVHPNIVHTLLQYIFHSSGCLFLSCTVSENKTLCHPASVDSLSTSAGTEDHVSMGGFAARKALQVVRNVEKVGTTTNL